MTAVRTAALISGASVAVVAAIGSYSHTQRLAAGHGETWLSYLLPLSVDGLLVVASLAMVRARRAGESPPGLAWFALVLGILVSLVANVAAAGPDLVSKLVSAWPPLALAVAFELVVTLARPTSTSDTRANPQVTTVPTSAGDPTPADPPTQEATPDAPN
jgi:hypothetical protein